MTHPILSIIVPIFNTAKLLDECLLSIRQQTLKEIEIICVDDCSPDNSYKIVEKHAQEDPRIRLIRHTKNKGQGGARNTGILAAKADYVAGVDSDDTIKPEMMEKLWEATEDGRFDIVCCGFDTVDVHGHILSQQKMDNQEIIIGKRAFDIFTIVHPAFWNKIWRRSLYIENEIFFPEKLHYEDMATTPRLVAISNNMRIIEFSGYNYLQRSNSITYNVSEKSTVDYFISFMIVSNFLVGRKLFYKYKHWFHGFVSGHLLYHANIIINSEMNTFNKQIHLKRLIALKTKLMQHTLILKGKRQGRSLYSLTDIENVINERDDAEYEKILDKKNVGELIYYLKHAISKTDIKSPPPLLRIKKSIRDLYKKPIHRLTQIWNQYIYFK